MANLQVRDIDEKLYNTIKKIASSERRSISQEVVYILENYLSQPDLLKNNPTDEFLKLSGSWDDERTAEKIVEEIKENRQNSNRFRNGHELFD